MLYESSEKLHSPDKHDDEFVVSVVSNPLTVLLTLRKPFEGFLTEEETLEIITELQKLAKENGGLDYLQTYKKENGDKVWIIDQLDEKMKTEHPPEHNYFTILLPSEY